MFLSRLVLYMDTASWSTLKWSSLDRDQKSSVVGNLRYRVCQLKTNICFHIGYLSSSLFSRINEHFRLVIRLSVCIGIQIPIITLRTIHLLIRSLLSNLSNLYHFTPWINLVIAWISRVNPIYIYYGSDFIYRDSGSGNLIVLQYVYANDNTYVGIFTLT